MAPYIRTTIFDARLLRGLAGTTVTTYDLASDGASPESTSRTWVITEKLAERAVPMTEHDVRMGRGSLQTVGKPFPLEAFKLLQSGRCSAVPRFLGHAERIQGEHDLLPGGYIRYFVWEKVPGEPLTEEFFWGLDDAAREDIRSKFRAAYNRISGFRRGWPIIDRLEWSEACYVEYGLAKPSKETDWYLHPEKWEW
ncbi:hypothetical protein Asppvi_009593 [Aspergillus pseudoviridinutans]|uniref:Uncharacterized protein n=1 Tax=Aspergillus pseudoviridinutans TaxID=1517512 RepID=A0A9P3BG11_9EURO|nr:uncharacterized protein Asppvi_009593 [Aspergillus pseudoviridinutans]GIJ90632.1 hypothetical protein Asppvi_009593 [Aspergillus pseudoviridinutans]